MRAVNLLPAGQRRRRGLALPKRAVAGLAVLVLGAALGGWGYAISSSTAAAERELTAAQSERAQVQIQLGSYRVAQQRLATLASEREAIETLTSARVDWERLIRAVATVLPPQVWLTGLKAQTPTVAAAPGVTAAPGATSVTANGLHLDGMAFSQTQVALTMARIAAVPGLGLPVLSTSQAQTVGTRTLISFSMEVPIDQRAQGQPSASGGTAGTPSGTPSGTSTTAAVR
jgi:Tfp pilus assembly protein PilN